MITARYELRSNNGGCPHVVALEIVDEPSMEAASFTFGYPTEQIALVALVRIEADWRAVSKAAASAV